MNTKPVLRSNLFALMFFLGYLGVSSILTTFLLIVAPDQAVLLSTILSYGLIFGGGIVLFLLYTHTSPRQALGLRGVPPTVVVLSILLGLTIIPLLSLISYVSSFWVTDHISGAVNNMLSLPLGTLILLLAVLPALFEEAVCRGIFLYGYRGYSVWAGALFNGLFFAILHGNIHQALYAFVGGFVFALVASASDSLLPSILAHFTLNGIQAFAAYSTRNLPTEDMSMAFSWQEFGALAQNAIFFTLISAIIIYQIFKRCGNLHLLKNKREESDRSSFPPLNELWPLLVLFLVFLGFSIISEVIPA